MVVTFKATIADSDNVENINATGSIVGKKVGVFAYLGTPTATTTTLAGTYYPIQGTFTNSPSECFGAATTYTPGIKYECETTQYLEIDWHASVGSDAGNTTVTCGVYKNGVLEASSVMSTFAKNLGQIYAMSGTTVIELAQNDEVQLVVKSDQAGAQVTFNNYTTSISEFFD